MPDTESYYSGLLDRIDAQISGLISSGKVDYQVGNVRVSASQRLEQLTKMRQSILDNIARKPNEQIETLQSDTSAFGEDHTSYVDTVF